MRWLKYLGWGVVLLLAAGSIFQAVGTNRTLHHPPGSLIDAGGYKMHLYCTGQGASTVILDAGLGDSWMSWQPVQSRIATFARVCSYDRAGMGWSEPRPAPRTSRSIAEELHSLLRNARVPAPYILVGHSFGGYNVRIYTDRYRQDVAAIVLIDSSHPDQIARLPQIRKYQARYEWLLPVTKYSMLFGIPRIVGACPAGATAECSYSWIRETEAEYKGIEESAAQVRATAPLGDLPLRVLSRDPERVDPPIPQDVGLEANREWTKMQEELAALSTNGKRIVAPGCGHYIHVCNPTLVVEAVRELTIPRIAK